MKVLKLLSWLVMSLCLLCGKETLFSQTNFWMQTNGPFGGNVNALAIHSTGEIVAGMEGGLFRSSDNGESWSLTGLSDIRVFSLAINASGHIFAGTEGGGIFRSMDNGDNWTAINTGLTNTDVFVLAVNASDDIFAGTFDTLFRSTDNGDTWVSVSAGLPPTPVTKTLAINADGHLFTGTREGAYRSTDNGDNWTPIKTGLPNVPVNDYAITASGQIYAGTSGAGVYRSIDNGDNWIPMNTGLTNSSVQALAINAQGYLFGGSFGSGVFRSVETITAVEDISGAIPVAFFLEQNYPNPFNPSTAISYQLSAASDLELSIYNVLGQKVRTLVSGEFASGKYEVIWDGTDDAGMRAASGVYFVTMQAGRFVQTRKLTLMK